MSKEPTISKYNFDVPWENLLENKDFLKVFLSDVLEQYIVKQRWYGGKSSKIKYIELSEYFRIQQNDEVYFGLILEVDFIEAFYHHYFIPIAFVSDENFAKKDRILPVSIKNQEGFIIDAVNLESFRKLVFERIANAEAIDKTKVQYHKSDLFSNITYESSGFLGLEQSNTSLIFNEKYVLKFFRRIFSNKNPDYEMNRFLTERKDFKNTPKYFGSINFIQKEKDLVTIAVMQELIPNEGDAWQIFLKEIDKVFSTLKEKNIDINNLPEPELYQRLRIHDIPHRIIDWAGLNLFLKLKVLAKRTAEMHINLGSEFEDTAFTPTHFNGDYEVWLKNRMIYQFQNRLNIIENNLHKLDGYSLEMAKDLLSKKSLIRSKFLNFDWKKLKGERIRIHGDYHLGQILVQENDFYILDFEGEPESTIRDRQVKQPPMKDVAGLFRSFHYAIYATIFNNKDKYNYSQEELFKAAELLYGYFTGVFLGTYVFKVQQANLNIGYSQERNFILEYCLLEKAVYELGYELNSRPSWAVIPLKGISNLINN
ncbi:maltose alpha-D-glucosyltransferase/ alpha-amylase [Lutibacter agarilyticus]|uniref:Maltose alpha-D-glucosyltransferase/ alpha-amylase n=1 Tax=Lutibacter agarilyticus TaxID=1109740 RepID=A0A238VFM4_9FLAO|nr:trehalose synthase [Lutibacter agarilyticus]SNR33011.1 maltose alpha-D-glucosyltransferase/ alpha-amylase [Lutibacter agarilyticus]